MRYKIDIYNAILLSTLCLTGGNVFAKTPASPVEYVNTLVGSQ